MTRRCPHCGGQIRDPDPELERRVRLIQMAVARELGLTLEALLGTVHSDELARARRVAMYVARKTTRANHDELAELFQRDRKTVGAAIRHVGSAHTHDPDLYAFCERFMGGTSTAEAAE